jgi:RNA polymerase sigma factor (sigma-70 family)
MSPADSETHRRFELLLERYSTLLRGLIGQHCPRHLGVEASDVEQEARVRLWRALEREKELTDPASYTYRIAVTTTIDAVRRVLARREDQVRVDDEDDSETESVQTFVTDQTQSPDSVTERRELMSGIGAAVQSLAENRRRAVVLHLQGLNLNEIAELLGWTEGKARNLVDRGLDDLRDALRREGVDYE